MSGFSLYATLKFNKFMIIFGLQARRMASLSDKTTNPTKLAA